MKLPKYLRTTLLLVTVFWLISPIQAQLIAGTVPPGAVGFNPNISMVIPNGADSVGFDLNCDMVDDLRVVLVFGASTIDTPNTVGFTSLDSTLQFCVDTVQGLPFPVTTLHDAGDTLTCPGPAVWSLNTNIWMGYYGCVCPQGPEEEYDRCVHYRMGAQEGWIKVSFDVNNVATVIAVQIDSLSAFCTSTDIAEASELPALTCYPNPTLDGLLRVETQLNIRHVTVYDSKGTTVHKGPFLNQQVHLPEAPGLYFLIFEDQFGETIRHTALRR
jgi:hypothetical protein